MKNFITVLFCIFLAGNAFSGTDILRGEGDTLFVRDVKSFKQVIEYDSAGYSSSGAQTVFWTIYKVIDTVFVDSVTYRNFPKNNIIDAMSKPGDTLFLEPKISSVYTRDDWFSVKHTKTETAYLVYDDLKKQVFGGVFFIEENKNSTWKLIVIVLFIIFIPVFYAISTFSIKRIASFFVGTQLGENLNLYTKVGLDFSLGSICTFVFLAIVLNMIAGIPVRLLLDSPFQNIKIEGYTTTLWWVRVGVEFVILVSTSWYVLRKNIRKILQLSIRQEKPDSVPDAVAGAE